MTGEVKWFDIRKRYGFILPEGVAMEDKDAHVFVHESILEQPLSAGQLVEYAVYPNTRKPKAMWVKIIDKRAYVPIDRGRKGAYGTD